MQSLDCTSAVISVTAATWLAEIVSLSDFAKMMREVFCRQFAHVAGRLCTWVY